MTTVALPSTLSAPATPLRFEDIPKLRAFVQTLAGKLTLVFAFAGLMKVTKVDHWEVAAIFLALMSVLPQRRKLLLVGASICWIFLAPPLIDHPYNPVMFMGLAQQHGAAGWTAFWPLVAAGVWLFGIAYTWLARRYPKSLPGKRPVVGLVLVLLALLLLQQLLTGAAWFFVATSAMVLGHFIWFFAYSASDSRDSEGAPRATRPGFWRPFWYAFKIPIGKGAAYLERVEAKNADELATCQLKGLKLLWWAFVLLLVKVVAGAVIYGPHNESATRIPYLDGLPGLIPTYPVALKAHLAGNPYAWHVRWLALIAELFFAILYASIWGHKIVAVMRMAGFNALRNTYRPLESTTIAEFYNRFNYYFKELLVTFFFFPTYLRYFKRHPRVRLFMATLAAAGGGNFLYHFLHFDRHIFQLGFFNALLAYHAQAVYCLILGTAIGLSQLRAHMRRREAPPTGFRKYRAIAGVMLFYCFMTMFFDNSVDLTIADYGSYFLSLFWP
jgi:hypothetical protein